MTSQRTSQGQVVAVRDGMAEVQVAVASACGACRAKSVCGSGHVKTVRIPVSSGITPGATLSIGMAETDINLAVLIGYLLPAVALLAGAVLLSPWGDNFAALGAGLGLVAGLVAMHLLQRTRFADRFIPTVTSAETPCASGNAPTTSALS